MIGPAISPERSNEEDSPALNNGTNIVSTEAPASNHPSSAKSDFFSASQPPR